MPLVATKNYGETTRETKSIFMKDALTSCFYFKSSLRHFTRLGKLSPIFMKVALTSFLL